MRNNQPPDRSGWPRRLPTKDEFRRVWQTDDFGENQKEAIVAIYNQPLQEASSAQVAVVLKFKKGKKNNNSANSPIGLAGKTISTALKITPLLFNDEAPSWWSIYCTYIKETSSFKLLPDFCDVIAECNKEPAVGGADISRRSTSSEQELFDLAFNGQHFQDALATTASVILSWQDTSVRDVLPLEWFESDSPLLRVVHEMRGGSGGKAMCDVAKSGVFATLDYLPYKTFNARSGALSGKAQLTFVDIDRVNLAKFAWQGEGGKTFIEDQRSEYVYTLPPAPPYTMPTMPAPKVAQMVRPRPGQALFRKTMDLAYGACCSVTGSSVPKALEAAHIDDYRALESNNARNGLLLRRDIHALFDAHLIAIEPGCHVVHVAAKAKGMGGYDEFHGKKIKLPAEKSHHPDSAALKRRWDTFKSSHP